MKKSVTIAAATLMAFSLTAFAARPTSISFDQQGTAADGTAFEKYVVNCSNGKSMPLTAWNNRKSWCIGKESKENCHHKQLKAAQAACRTH